MLAPLVTALAVVYTVGLLVLARRSRRQGAGGFVDGGRRFSSRQVMISALWCSSIFVVEMETGYLYGVSGVWFGSARWPWPSPAATCCPPCADWVT